MEMKPQYTYPQKKIGFKIDLIVWKYEAGDFKSFDIFKFKIDLIVWK